MEQHRDIVHLHDDWRDTQHTAASFSTLEVGGNCAYETLLIWFHIIILLLTELLIETHAVATYTDWLRRIITPVMQLLLFN